MHKVPQKSHLLFRIHLDTLRSVVLSLLPEVLVRVHVNTGFFLASPLRIAAWLPRDAEPSRELKRHVGVQAGGVAPSSIPADKVLSRITAVAPVCRI